MIHTKLFYLLCGIHKILIFCLLDDPPPYMDGVRINSPHYLCKMLDNGPDSGLYTLVVSQYDKSTTIHYTIRAYSNCEFILQKISESYNPKYEREVSEYMLINNMFAFANTMICTIALKQCCINC